MATINSKALLDEANRSAILKESGLVDRLATLAHFIPEQFEGEPDLQAVQDYFCDELDDPTRGTVWSLSPGLRVDRLVAMLERGGNEELARVRETVVDALDSPLQRMLDLFIYQKELPLADCSEDELIESLTVLQWASEVNFRVSGTDDLKTGPDRTEIEGQLALFRVTRPIRKLVDAGCFRRGDQLKRLHTYVELPPGPLDVEPTMVVYGLGGVGKSTLVAQFVKEIIDRGEQVKDGANRPAWAYVDMDRPALRSYEALAILDDILRQVSAQFPEHNRELDYLRKQSARSEGEGLESIGPLGSYHDLSPEFARVMKEVTDGPFIVVIDTFEEVERADESRRREIYEMFHLLSLKLKSLKLVVSGRAPAMDFVNPTRPERTLEVKVFEESKAIELLRFFTQQSKSEDQSNSQELDDALCREVIEVVGGNPLAVKLAARVLTDEGTAGFHDAVHRASTIEAVRHEFVRGFLYSRVLDHIMGEDERDPPPPNPISSDVLRAVARGALVLRRVTPAIIEAVLRPAVEIQTQFSSDHVFDLLAREVAFAQAAGQELTLRQELRGPALKALSYDDPEFVERVNRLAKDFYISISNNADAPSSEAVTELAYHRMALGEPPEDVIELGDDASLRRLESVLEDLPAASAKVIRSAIDQPGKLEEAQELSTWELRVLSDVESWLQKAESPRQISDAVDRAWKSMGERIERTPGTKLFGLESLLHEIRKDFSKAAEAAKKEREASELAGDRFRYAAAAVRVAALLEMDYPVEASAELRDACADPILAGHHELCLELKLNEIITRERTGLLDDANAWSLGLEARGFLNRIAPDAVERNTALLRLLAAGFGSEEPSRLHKAARVIGLGADEVPQLSRALARAIADWDSETKDSSLATQVGLTVRDDDPENTWLSALSGLGTEGGRLLDRLWKIERPPEPVREAIRVLYVWWGAKYFPREDQKQDDGVLRVDSLVLSRDRLRELEKIILSAYPDREHLLTLAKSADAIPPNMSIGDLPPRAMVRQILGHARFRRRIQQLVQFMLGDSSITSLHWRLLGWEIEWALSEMDHALVAQLLDWLSDNLDKTDRRIDEKMVKVALATLRKYARFEEFFKLGEKFQAGEQNDPRVRCELAQAQIETGEITRAIEDLTILKKELETEMGVNGLMPSERKNIEENLGETLGLIGRAYKQLYVNAKPRATEPRLEDLDRSLEHYSKAYNDGLGDYLWHGINYVALLTHAERVKRGVPSVYSKEAERHASAILSTIEDKERQGPLWPWDVANRTEAFLALGKNQEAVDACKAYLSTNGLDAFQVQSTRRQFMELWLLNESEYPGSHILPMMTARFAELGGGRAQVDLTAVKKQNLEKVWGETKYQSLDWLLQAVARTRCVARLGPNKFEGWGSGFLIDGSWIDVSWSDRKLLLTNAHVCTDDRDVQAQYPYPKGAEENTATFLGSLGEEGEPIEIQVKEVLWTSAPSELDASLLELADVPKETEKAPLLPEIPSFDRWEEKRVNILGHPRGLSLRVSLQDSKLVSVDDRYLHYRTPTDPGSNGSPIFNQKWELVGLHHSASKEMRAHEGIRIDVIIDAIKRDLGAW
jgi:GTPase SAR1 family protein